MIKIAYRVLAVPERQEHVQDILQRLKCDESIVFYDNEHNGCMWNALRLWGSYKEMDRDITHVCLIADDALIVRQFAEASLKCAQRFPNAIWSFATYDAHKRNRGPDSPYVQLWNCNLRGLCYMMPVELIPGYIDFYDRYLSQKKKWERDDVTCKMYAMTHGIPVMMPIPNLAIAKHIPSVIPGHWKTNRIEDCWYGEDIDLRQFDTFKYYVTKGRSLFDMHLKPDEPAYIITEKAYRQKLKADVHP